jgi:hypothetical protein
LGLLLQDLLVLFTLLQEGFVIILELGDFHLLFIKLLLKLSNLLLIFFQKCRTHSKNLRLVFIIHLIGLLLVIMVEFLGPQLLLKFSIHLLFIAHLF